MGTPRIDAIYHEIGHNLGLDHTSNGAVLNLMTDGALRFAPSSINDITPDGANMDQLTPDQIATALASPLVVADAQVPEPASWVLGAAVLFLPLLRRRTSAS